MNIKRKEQNETFSIFSKIKSENTHLFERVLKYALYTQIDPQPLAMHASQKLVIVNNIIHTHIYIPIDQEYSLSGC